MRAARYSRRQMRSGPLVLVNRQHPLAEEPRQLLTAADERYPNILLERQAARLLAACIQSVGGQGKIVPVSGWRSQQEQQRENQLSVDLLRESDRRGLSHRNTYRDKGSKFRNHPESREVRANRESGCDRRTGRNRRRREHQAALANPCLPGKGT